MMSRISWRQTPGCAYLQAVLDVAFDHLGRERRGEGGVRVDLGDLVLDEVGGMLHLADVVVVGPDLGEQRVGADPLCGPLGEAGPPAWSGRRYQERCAGACRAGGGGGRRARAASSA